MTDLHDPQNHPLWDSIAKFSPGFFGAVIAAYYVSKPSTKRETITAIAAGTLTSIFLAPYIAELTARESPGAISGIGFAVGMVTVVFVPVAVRKALELINAINWKLIGEWLPWKKPQQ